jgi:hypothetical protein
MGLHGVSVPPAHRLLEGEEGHGTNTLHTVVDHRGPARANQEEIIIQWDYREWASPLLIVCWKVRRATSQHSTPWMITGVRLGLIRIK